MQEQERGNEEEEEDKVCFTALKGESEELIAFSFKCRSDHCRRRCPV